MNRPFEDFLASFGAIVLCGYSAYKGLQVVAIFSMVVLLGIIYKRQALAIGSVLVDLVRATKQAKSGNLEVQIQSARDISESLVNSPEWFKILASAMNEQQIGLMLEIQKEGKYVIAGSGVREILRSLRSMGMINHDKASLTDSMYVSLTPLGTEVAETLRSLQSAPRREADPGRQMQRTKTASGTN